jgi:hypothetical protein
VQISHSTSIQLHQVKLSQSAEDKETPAETPKPKPLPTLHLFKEELTDTLQPASTHINPIIKNPKTITKNNHDIDKSDDKDTGSGGSGEVKRKPKRTKRQIAPDVNLEPSTRKVPTSIRHKPSFGKLPNETSATSKQTTKQRILNVEQHPTQPKPSTKPESVKKQASAGMKKPPSPEVSIARLNPSAKLKDTKKSGKKPEVYGDTPAIHKKARKEQEKLQQLSKKPNVPQKPEKQIGVETQVRKKPAIANEEMRKKKVDNPLLLSMLGLFEKKRKPNGRVAARN